MTVAKQDIDDALADLATRYPQTFVLEEYQPHRPLKVGIAADLRERCPAVERRVRSVALSVYAKRIMYLQGLVAGAPRIDLDGNPAGEVTARDAEHAATKLAGILASREAAAVAARGGKRVVTLIHGKPPIAYATLRPETESKLGHHRPECE